MTNELEFPSKLIPHIFDFATTEEFLEGLRARREFVMNNNPVEIIKRMVEIDEARVCPEGVCDGSGEVPNLILDPDSHEWITDGNKKCLCQLNNHKD